MGTTKTQEVILGLKAFSSEGLELLKQALHALSEALTIDAVSSVYRVSGEREKSAHIHDLRSFAVFDGIVLAVKGFTGVGPNALVLKCREIEARYRNETLRRSVNIQLFFYGTETLMGSQLTLPDPDFHLRPENILPAAEICPEFVHPVLKRSVRDLARPFSGQNWGEFVSQGKAMLDFSARGQ